MSRARVWIGLLGSLAMAAGCAQAPPTVNESMPSNRLGEPYNLRIVQQATGDMDVDRPGRRVGPPDQDDDFTPGEGGRRVGPPDQDDDGALGDGGRRVGPPGDGGRRVGPRDRDDGFVPRDGGRRVGPPGDDGRRVGPPARRMERPGWWGSRAWWGRGSRPVWWGSLPYSTSQYILVGDYYYPFIVYRGFYYPDFSSPHVFLNGFYVPYYGLQQPTVRIESPIPLGSATIVTVQPSQVRGLGY